MFVHKNLTAAACACALALGLAACTGGGAGGPTAADIDRLIAAAKSAVDAAASPAGAAVTDTLLEAASKAVDAATDALTGADSLSDEKKSELEQAISVLAGNLATVRRAAVGKLSAAIAGPQIAGVRAAFAHGEAPSMSGTVPGTPPVPVAGLETAAADAARSVSGWRGDTYTAAAGGVADTVSLYTSIEAPGTRPFSGDDGKYSAANGLDTDGNLPIVAATDPTLVASAAFPSGPGIVSHETGADGTARIAGTFDGAAGAYLCTPAKGGACTSSVRHGGGYTLAGGSWKFVPAAGAVIPDPDTEYQYFGWWLRQADGAYVLGVFHAGAGGASDELGRLRALQGTATYRGPAVGLFAVEPRIGEPSAGEFAATVTLAVDFGDDTDLGTVDGDVGGFTANGEAKPWSVALGSARIGPDGAIAAGGDDAALTVWSDAGNAGATPPTSPPTWSGQLHDAGDDSVPAVVTGRFEAVYDDAGRMIGAFGATLQP